MKNNKTYEQIVEELKFIVDELENNKNLPLDKAISYFETASNLISECEKKLKEAENKINKIEIFKEK
ncbi:exodeoxyribonuclease VII small subunit [symbiont of Argiope bruennichi]|uniref:exodeoxyribonuclease VII small subunit n=1 Tax=symbiont of Argiope bruennichi TaxID=2810479 RepID=UPI003DA4F1D6